jgi:hypothetical protein
MASEGEAPNTRISNWTLATATCPGHREVSAAANPNSVTCWRAGRPIVNRSPLTVIVVSDGVLRPELLDTLLMDESDYNVIVLESNAHAYSRIGHPDLVAVHA